MADIRELIILSPGILDPKPESVTMRRFADFKMAVRRIVVRTAAWPVLRTFYLAMYKVHLWIAKEIGSRFEGTSVVYAASGLGTGDVHIGVSDVDIAIYGTWPEERQFRLMKIFGALTFLSPLFDKRSLAQICTVNDLRAIAKTDMLMALMYAKGAQQWKVLYGRNVLGELEPIAPERFDGCVYMDVRRWWSLLAGITFGSDVTARDPIFQNTTCFKTVAETLRAERMLHGGFDFKLRRALVEEHLQTEDDPLLRMLLESAGHRFLTIAHDPRGRTLEWFLLRAERMHAQMPTLPSFVSSAQVEIAGTMDERFLAPATLAHAQHLLHIAQDIGLDAAYLVPSITLMSADSMALIFKFTGHALPGSEDLRRLTQAHLAGGKLPQRLAIYILLPHAAYQLDAGASIEFFHYTFTPQTAPDVFHHMAQPGAAFYGPACVPQQQAGWSTFAHELVMEELEARRGAYRRSGPLSRPVHIENLRNLWRFLQLSITARSANDGKALLPTTIPAIRRAATLQLPHVATELAALELIHHGLLVRGESAPERTDQLIQQIYDASFEDC